MAALKAYFDDSGEEEDPQHCVCTVAGYVASAEAWVRVEAAWNAALSVHDVPYLHMKEFAHFHGPFARFKNDEAGRVALLKALIDVVADSELEGVGSITRLQDLRRFNSEHGTRVGAYPFNLYTNMAQVSVRWPNTPVEVVIDRTTNHGPKAAKAREYANTDAYYPDCGRSIQLIPLEHGFSFRNVPALQIADFLAWESRKDVETKDEWFATIKTGDDFDAWFKSLADWSQSRGHSFPYNRKSVSALLRARPVEGVVWDYRGILTVDKARKGIWP